MKLDYFNTKSVNHLIEEIFYLSFDKSDIPFKSTILPIGRISITYTFDNTHYFTFNNKNSSIKGLILSGQFYESYRFSVNAEGHSFGVSLHPTALYKLTKLDASKLTSRQVLLSEFSKSLYDKLISVFMTYENDIKQINKNLKQAILELPQRNDSITDQIDLTIEEIRSRDGMLNTYELLDYVDFSQKTLETNFKKIVGLTPGRYIRLYRFLKLMRKYESKEINLKDLIYMYNYHDHSHFSKDFKHFMKQSPKDYFKEEHAFLNEYLSK